MTLLFLKNRKSSLIIICISLLFYSFNSSKKENINDSFLTLCKNSDAYYKHSSIDVFFTKKWYRVNRETTVSTKLVVNNTTGVDNYAFLKLNEYEANHIKTININTLKADGSIIKLDTSLVFKQNSKNKKMAAINYPIPAVEPGDTIETNYIFTENLNKNELMNYVNLNIDLPIKRSKYSIKTGKNLVIRYKGYNDFPEPEIISNDSLINLNFTTDNIKGYSENEYSCMPCELPYLYYTLENRNSEVRTWNNVYNEEFNILTQPIALDTDRSSYYKRWKRRVIGKAKDSTKYYKFKLIHSKIIDDFTLEAPKRDEVIKSSGYFLKEKKFDPISIRRFYRQILEDLDIQYWAVFGRSKRLGTIDTQYIRKGEFDHIFFAYTNKNGFISFLYPHEDTHMYQIDEIPTSLYSTEAVLVKPVLKKKKSKKNRFITRNLVLAKADSVSVSSVKLPGMDSNYNYTNQTISGNVNLEEKKTYFNYRFKVSGGLSTEIRSFFKLLNKNKEVSTYYDALSEFEGEDNTIQIDTVTSTYVNKNKPFAFGMNAKGTLNNAITFSNDKMISLSIDKLIQHNQLKSNTESSELNYYLDYSYSDNFLFYLNFPCNIDVLGIENSTIDFKNETGEYYFKIKKSKDNQLLFHSKYKIKENLIPKENYNQLKQLNEQVKKVKSKRLIIKLIKE